MPYQQVTLTQLLGLLDNQLGAASGVWWTQNEKIGIINEGLRVWNSLTGYWKATGVALGSGSPKVTVADQVWYSLPGTITSSMRMTFNGVPLFPSSLQDLDQGRQYWESETTVSAGSVPDKPQLWGIGAMNLVAIWPADHVGGNSLMMDGIAITPVLAGLSDYLNIGEQELNGLLNYWQHVAMFKDGGDEFASSMGQFKDFLKQAGTTNSLLMASSKFRGWMGADAGKAEHPYRAPGERVGAR